MPEPVIDIPASRIAQLAERYIEMLNSECFCISLDDDALRRALESELGAPGLFHLVEERCPYLFAARPVFVSNTHMDNMAQAIRAIESVIALPAYRAQVLADAPAIARHDPGGAMLNAVLARAQRACCAEVEEMLPPLSSAAELEQAVADMFLSEWALSKRERPLRCIAIVDEAPQQQYLYPEFLLFQQLFQRHGLQAVIADPSELTLRDGVLWHGATAIDMVYNRLTDFLLEAPSSAALRAAYLSHAVVLTPHPQAHALYADKRNLALLGDADRLQALGVPAPVREILVAGIPRTEVVQPANAERLWSERRKLFFKPMAGYGSRAAYRGDKLTKRVWEDILAGDYVAQAIVAPGQRTIDNEEAPQVLKFDVRNYAYGDRVQWVAARLYQGQTTNFRTPGGGFAPVYSLPPAWRRALQACRPPACGTGK